MTGSARVAWLALCGLGALLCVACILEPTLALLLIVGLAGFALALRSPAIPLAAYSGATLASLVLADRLPEGATVASYGAWMLLGSMVAVVRNPRGRPPLSRLVGWPMIGTLALLALMAVRLPASLSPGYGSDKMQLAVLTLAIPYAAALIVGMRRSDLLLYLKLFAGLGVATAFYGLYQIAAGASLEIYARRFTLSEEVNPIELGRFMAVTILVLLFWLAGVRTPVMRVALGIAIMPCAAVMLSSGSRQPLVALLLALPVLLISRVRDRRAFRRLLVGLLAAVVLATGAVATLAPTAAVDRALSTFTGSDQEQGEESRLATWDVAWEAAKDAPIVGLGTGSFLAVHGTLSYPHNIALEAFMELGILGLAALALAILPAFWILARIALDRREQRPDGAGPIAGLLLALLTFAVLVSMVSGDIPINGGIWRLIGLGTGLAAAASMQKRHQRERVTFTTAERFDTLPARSTATT